MTWHAACDKMIPKEPVKGWELVDNAYQIVWFTGSQMPDSVLPDSAYSIDDDVDSDAETPEPCFDLDFDDSESDGDAYSEPEDDELKVN